jgi:hypothetical protein
MTCHVPLPIFSGIVPWPFDRLGSATCCLIYSEGPFWNGDLEHLEQSLASCGTQDHASFSQRFRRILATSLNATLTLVIYTVSWQRQRRPCAPHSEDVRTFGFLNINTKRTYRPHVSVVTSKTHRIVARLAKNEVERMQEEARQQSLNYSRNDPPFEKSEESLPCSKEPDTRHCPQPDKSSVHFKLPVSLRSFLILPYHLRQLLFLHQDSNPKCIGHCSQSRNSTPGPQVASRGMACPRPVMRSPLEMI